MFLVKYRKVIIILTILIAGIDIGCVLVIYADLSVCGGVAGKWILLR